VKTDRSLYGGTEQRFASVPLSTDGRCGGVFPSFGEAGLFASSTDDGEVTMERGGGRGGGEGEGEGKEDATGG